jgi:hypothetical protein
MIVEDMKYKITVIDLSDATAVPHTTGTNNQDLQPDAGKVYEIIGMFMSIAAPIGDTSGTHQQTINRYDGTSYRTVGTIKGNHSTSLSIEQGGFVGDSLERPSDSVSQYNIIFNGYIKATNTYPIRFTYTNNTDANQTGTRTLIIWVKEYQEAA